MQRFRDCAQSWERGLIFNLLFDAPSFRDASLSRKKFKLLSSILTMTISPGPTRSLQCWKQNALHKWQDGLSPSSCGHLFRQMRRKGGGGDLHIALQNLHALWLKRNPPRAAFCTRGGILKSDHGHQLQVRLPKQVFSRTPEEKVSFESFWLFLQAFQLANSRVGWCQ